MIAAWWARLEVRERLLVMVAGVLALIVVLYQFMLVPAQGYAETQDMRFQTALSEYNDVRRVAQSAVGHSEPDSASQPLQVVLTNTAELYGLSITRIAPAEGNGLNLWLDDVSPQLVYAWIGDLENSHRIRVGKASLRADPDSDTVSANFYMSRDL
ncbi:MAG: type II secretion system protein GspM [Pseudomonadota bacterium]